MTDLYAVGFETRNEKNFAIYRHLKNPDWLELQLMTTDPHGLGVLCSATPLADAEISLTRPAELPSVYQFKGHQYQVSDLTPEEKTAFLAGRKRQASAARR